MSIAIGFPCKGIYAIGKEDKILYKSFFDNDEDYKNRYDPNTLGIKIQQKVYNNYIKYLSENFPYYVKCNCGNIYAINYPLAAIEHEYIKRKKTCDKCKKGNK
jgi:hypothetical protein